MLRPRDRTTGRVNEEPLDRTEETVKARRSSLLSVVVLAVALVPVPALSAPAAAAPEGRSEAPAGRSEAPAGQVTFAVHISPPPTWLDPSQTPAVNTAFLM